MLCHLDASRPLRVRAGHGAAPRWDRAYSRPHAPGPLPAVTGADPARPVTEPVAAALAEVWASVAAACAGLDAGDWDRPTDCPGWSVRDQLAHLVGIELTLDGEPAGPALPAGEWPPHVRNPFGAQVEVAVAARRDRPGRAVLEEFEAVTDRRLAALAALGPDEWGREVPGPLGTMPYRGLMGIRLFDSWVHEQDIRRALDRPGGRGGAGEADALDRVSGAMAAAVGKRAALPEGTVVRFDVDGPLPRQVRVAVRQGRGVGLAADDPAAPDVVLGLPAELFWRLGCGRVDPALALAGPELSITGDRPAGRAVVAAMNFMF